MKRITISHDNDPFGGSGTLKEFTITQWTTIPTMVEDVEFTPLAHDVYKDLLHYLINHEKFMEHTHLSHDAALAILDRHYLMMSWLMVHHPKCFQVLKKKHIEHLDSIELGPSQKQKVSQINKIIF